MNQSIQITRRAALALTGAPLAASFGLAGFCSLAHAVPTDVLTVLYRRSTVNAPTRLDPAVQAASAALEDEFGKRGFRVVQPSADIYAMLDRGPEVAVSFAPEAGFSMLFSAQRSLRPMPGVDKGVAEVILQCRVFVGHSIALTEEAKGMIATSLEADVREFAERRSGEQAAQRAAAALADKVARRLKALSPADIQQMAELKLPPGPVFSHVALPVEPPAPAPAPSMATAPVTAPADVATETLPPPKRKFALVIAVSDYSGVRQRLGYPEDLKGVAIDRRNLVAGLQAQGFPSENIQVLADAEATSAGVRDQLGKLVAKVQLDDLVVIAISAHGAPGTEVPSGFGMPVLSDFSKDNRGALDFWQLQSLVGNMPARRTVLMIDTCHSGGAVGMMSAVVSTNGVSVQSGPVTPDPARMAQLHTASARAFAVLTASRPEEYSLEDASGGGLFTSIFLRGLKDSKGQESLEQVFHEHVEKQVIEQSKTMCQRMGNCKVQTPLFAYAGLGNQIRL